MNERKCHIKIGNTSYLIYDHDDPNNSKLDFYYHYAVDTTKDVSFYSKLYILI